MSKEKEHDVEAIVNADVTTPQNTGAGSSQAVPSVVDEKTLQDFLISSGTAGEPLNQEADHDTNA